MDSHRKRWRNLKDVVKGHICMLLTGTRTLCIKKTKMVLSDIDAGHGDVVQVVPR